MNKQWLLTLFVFGWLPATLAHAMPPRDNVVVTQSELDEQAHLGINVTRTPVRDPGMRDIINGPGSVRPLVVGTKRFPVAAIKFPDFDNTNAIPQFDSMLFGTWPSGSAHDYYEQISYGVFNMTGVVVGWYTSSQNKAYYGYSNGFQRAARLVKEAAAAADTATNYALYDNDGDGYVDAFTCIHAGLGYEETGDGTNIWSHSWDFNSAGIGEYTTNDPWPGHSGQYIKVNDYTTDPERSNYSNHSNMVCIGVFCHEWGHALGLPDLYDTDGGGQGLGNWCLMASGSWGANNNSPWYPAQMDPWAKMELGWLNPTAVRLRNLYSLPQVETNAKAYWLPSRNRTFREYFLVENRRKTLSDTLMYSQGLLIYHIDDSVTLRRWADDQVNDGGSGWRYGVALEQADGADHLFNGGNRGDANDPWPGGLGRTTYDSIATTPNSRTNYPLAETLVSGCLVKNIPSSSPTMACTLGSGLVGRFTGGPDASGYAWIDSDTTGGPGYTWKDISTTGTLLGYGDDTRWSFGLPYNFNFYGTSYNTVWVCSNGWLSFGSDPGTNASANAAIPNAAAPNQAVFAFWDDLNGVQPDSGGIYYRNHGTSPNCSTVVMWKHARVKPSQDPVQNQVSFEVVLYENGRIQVRYRDLWLTDTLRKWGRSASVGIENAAGTVGLAYLYNGSPAGNLLANERTVEFRPPLRHDVGATRILVPTGTLDSGAVVTPACSVYNYGDVAETYNVRMKIGSLYGQPTQVSSHAPGTAVYVTFPGWTVLPRGTLAVACSTELSGDATPSNDKQTGSVTVAVRDVGTISLLAPSGAVDSGAVVSPACSVYNWGTGAATYWVKMKVGAGYSESTQVSSQSAGTARYVTFPSWTALTRGSIAVSCSTALATDMKTANDKLTGSVTVAVRDVGTTYLLTPSGTLDSGVAVTPACSVYNWGTGAATYWVKMKVGAGYSESTQVSNHGAGTARYATFPNWTPLTRGSITVSCSTALATDMKTANDMLTGSVTVRVRDVGVTRLVAPAGPLDSGAVATPACSVYNYGTTTETYPVRLYFGGFYDTVATVTSHAPGTRMYVTFPSWTASQRGTFTVTCTTRLTGDAIAANDRQTGTVSVRVTDAEATTIVAPVGSADSGSTVAPQARVTNNGSANATFDVTFGIAGTYNNTQAVTDLAPGASTVVSFDSWTASQRGTFTTACTTRLADDMVTANDTVSGTVTVAVHDIAALAIIAPAGPVMPGWSVTPAATVRNYGTQREACKVFFRIDCVPAYQDSLTLPGGLPLADTVATFANWTAIAGRYTATCSTWMAGDQQAANDLVSQGFTVGNPGWTQKVSMPAGAKPIKDGGWLAYDESRARIHASRGNKQADFYAYDPQGDSWSVRASWLPGTEGKLPSRSSAGCTDGSGAIYAVKGNATAGFYKFDANANAWSQKRDVPLGLSNKKLKGGSDITWAYEGSVGSPYLLKGYKNEFYRYDVAGDSWQTLTPAPIGSSVKWDKGSWLAYDDVNRDIYAFKAKYMDFYRYSPDGDSWSAALAPMPLAGSTGSKKAKDGSCGTFTGGSIYALKGGGTQQFFQYTIATNTWAEKETIPRAALKKKVNAGADIVAVGGVMYATKGNKTDELWMYVPSGSVYSAPRRDGVEAERLAIGDWRLSIAPNPVASGSATLRYSLSKAGLVRLSVFDVSGRSVFSQSLLAGRSGAVTLDLRRLSAGVYLVRTTASDFTATQKLVVQRQGGRSGE